MAFLGIPTSRKDLGNAGWIKGAATTGSRLAGNASSLLGNQDQAQRYRNFADAVDDPNRGYAGTLNPIKIVSNSSEAFGARGGSGNFGFTSSAPAGGGGDGSGGPQVQGAGVDVGANGLYAGGAGAYDPNKDAARVNQVKNEVRGLMQLFQQAFDSAMSRVDALAGEKRGQLKEKYTGEKDKLSRNYGDTSTAIDDQMAARGAFNSSYRAREQGTAKDAFETAFSGLNRAESEDEAEIGRFADQQKAELRASTPNYNVDDYGEVDDLQSIKQNVDQAVKALGVTNAGLGTSSQYKANLDRIAPETADKGNASLKSQLDRLAGTNANPEAKRFIAAQTIADAGEDPATWMDYFEQQNRLTGSMAQPGQALTVA